MNGYHAYHLGVDADKQAHCVKVGQCQNGKDKGVGCAEKPPTT